MIKLWPRRPIILIYYNKPRLLNSTHNIILTIEWYRYGGCICDTCCGCACVLVVVAPVVFVMVASGVYMFVSGMGCLKGIPGYVAVSCMGYMFEKQTALHMHSIVDR